MIPIPQQAVRGQVLTADMMNAIHRTLRRLRPIAGTGVSLQETDSGVILSVSATPSTRAEASELDFRFKVTASQEEKTVEGSEEPVMQWVLTIQPGSLWEVVDPIATEKVFTMLEGVTANATTGGWKVEDAATGSLFIARMTKGEDKTASEAAKNDGSNPTDLTDTTGKGESSSQESTTLSDEEASEIGVGYKLCFGSDTAKALFVIADFEPTATKPITQRTLGDVSFFPEKTLDASLLNPCAWRVRWNEEASSWQIFSPLWAEGQNQLLAEGCSMGWTNLPANLQAEGTLYATLHWLGTLNEDTGKTSWMLDPGYPQIVNALKDIPADSTPSASSGSGSEPTPGHKTLVVTLGTFTSSGTVKEDATDGEKWKALSFEQIHEGVIVETFTPTSSGTSSALPDGLTLYGEVSYDSSTGLLSQAILKWSQAQNAFVSAGSKDILQLERESINFVSEVALGTLEDTSSSSSGSTDALSATTRTIERWVLKTGTEDASTSSALLTFAPHEADEKTPYGSEDAP